jgi:hypothetical protein
MMLGEVALEAGEGAPLSALRRVHLVGAPHGRIAVAGLGLAGVIAWLFPFDRAFATATFGSARCE